MSRINQALKTRRGAVFAQKLFPELVDGDVGRTSLLLHHNSVAKSIYKNLYFRDDFFGIHNIHFSLLVVIIKIPERLKSERFGPDDLREE